MHCATKLVDIADTHTWREVEHRQIAACERLLATGVRRLPDSDHERETPDSLGSLYTVPTGLDVARYVGKTVLGTVRAVRDRRLDGDGSAERNIPHL